MVSVLGTDASARYEDVEAGCAFEGRASSDVEKSAAVGG